VLAVQAAVAAQTADRARTEAQARRVNDRIRALQSEADRLTGEARTLLGELRALEIEQQLQGERVREAQAAVERGCAAVEEATVRLEALEQQRSAQLPDLKAQLVDIYKRGRTGYAKLLLGASSVREFGRALRAVAALMRINETRVAEHRRTVDALRRERTRLEEELQALQATEAEARQAQAAADRALAARTRLLAQIDTRRDLAAQLAGELQLAYDRLQQQLASLAAGRPVDPVPVPLAPFRGTLEWPVTGRLLAPFGQSSGRFGETLVRNGIDIAVPAGTPVQAVHPGTVSYADPFIGFGNLVIVDHGSNTYSVYGYLESISVARGATVDARTELGRVGSAPTGPSALYFEVRVDGRSVDPIQWLRPVGSR
jgi:septal ring factor EnvC (AmiA/AmiB activator)